MRLFSEVVPPLEGDAQDLAILKGGGGHKKFLGSFNMRA